MICLFKKTFCNMNYRMDLRASVKLMETAEKIWQEALNLSNYIGVQFMGAADGTFISYPGMEFKQTYDHRSRPWYQLADSRVESESISMTTPYCDEWGAGMIYTIAKPLHGPMNNIVAVVAGDFTLQYSIAHFHKQIPYCTLHTCLLVDRTGYVVLKSDWVRHTTVPRTCANNTEIVAPHFNLLAPRRRWSLPACKPHGLTFVSAKNYAEQEVSQIPPCNDNKCDFQNETDCNNVVVCPWLNNEFRNVDTL